MLCLILPLAMCMCVCVHVSVVCIIFVPISTAIGKFDVLIAIVINGSLTLYIIQFILVFTNRSAFERQKMREEEMNHRF